ncbi:MAG TPA: NADH-quinone oxidoreductase subunit M [Gemmatimonadaceae bacterium]|nr:NADH-quinone oxidoreductase subunit M [Gemmatimonadaceae bacterium]
MRDFLTQMSYDAWVLPALLLIPLAGALLLLVTGALSSDDGTVESAPSARMIALVVFVLEFVVSMGLWWSYDPAGPRWQATFDHWWIIPWNARLSMGIDGISLMMVLLTTVIMPLAVLGSWTSIRVKVRSYYALMLILTTGMLGVFVARDMLFFYLMWEIMLIPMYFIIGIWGGERRVYASIKFFIYTTAGSLLMLVGIVYLWIRSPVPGMGLPASFDYDRLLSIAHTHTAALWLFGAFFLAFAVKTPMFPFHTWLPDAHVEAPTAGSVILASLMLKMGTYGFLRFAIPLFPSAALTPWVRTTVLTLAVIGIIYGALVAMVQPDFKKLVAYSSVSHLGFVVLGIFALTQQSVQGAMMVMINHGISTGALFLLIGMLYERRHTRLIAAYGGIARSVPLFSALLVLVSFSSIGLPSTNGFVGEFLVLLGSYRTHPYFTLFATTAVIYAAAYLLWGIQGIVFNRLDKKENEHISDLNARELTVMGVLVVAIFWIGIYPQPILRRMESSSAYFVHSVEQHQSDMNTASREGR